MWANAAAWPSTFSCLNKNLATFSLRSISRLALTASLFLELKLLSVWLSQELDTWLSLTCREFCGQSALRRTSRRICASELAWWRIVNNQHNWHLHSLPGNVEKISGLRCIVKKAHVWLLNVLILPRWHCEKCTGFPESKRSTNEENICANNEI